MIWNHSLIWALLPLAAGLEWRVRAVQTLVSNLALEPARPPAKAVGETAKTSAVRAGR